MGDFHWAGRPHDRPSINQAQYWNICVQHGAGVKYQVWAAVGDKEFFMILW
jgi:hypothetical protein